MFMYDEFIFLSCKKLHLSFFNGQYFKYQFSIFSPFLLELYFISINFVLNTPYHKRTYHQRRANQLLTAFIYCHQLVLVATCAIFAIKIRGQTRKVAETWTGILRAPMKMNSTLLSSMPKKGKRL